MPTESSTRYASPTIERLIPRSPYHANPSTIAAKVSEDIHFLQDRINRIKKLRAPNTSVLQTYQSMLDSRESVLQWLRDHGDLDDADIGVTHTTANAPPSPPDGCSS